MVDLADLKYNRENESYFAVYTDDKRMSRGRTTPKNNVTYLNVLDGSVVTVIAKVLGSLNNEYLIMISYDTSGQTVNVTHDCPDFERRPGLCKHVNLILGLLEPALIKKIFEKRPNLRNIRDVSSINQMASVIELSKSNHHFSRGEHEEGIAAAIEVFEKNNNLNVLSQTMEKTIVLEDPIHYLSVLQYYSFHQLKKQINLHQELQKYIEREELNKIFSKDAKPTISWKKYRDNNTPFSMLEQLKFENWFKTDTLDAVKISITKMIKYLKTSNKFETVKRVVSLMEILNMFPNNMRNEMLSFLQPEIESLPQNSFALELFEYIFGAKTLENPADYIESLMNEAFYSKIPPSQMDSFNRLSYFIKAGSDLVVKKTGEFSDFYSKYERDRYIVKLQLIKKMFYDYYDGKPFSYNVNFDNRGNYYSISPVPKGTFERFVFDKIGFDYSHPDYITREDYIKNFPLIKEFLDGDEIRGVEEFWGSPVPRISVVANFGENETVNIATEPNVKGKILIEWQILKNHLQGSFLAQTSDAQMVPLSEHPLTSRIQPFDIYLCEKAPAKIVDGVKHMIPIRKVHYNELPKILQYEIEIACSDAPLKELKELLYIVKNKDFSKGGLFSKIQYLKDTLLKMYLPKKNELLKTFVEITNQILQMDKDTLLDLLKQEDNKFSKEMVLAISGFNEFKKFFYDIDFKEIPTNEFNDDLGMATIMKYKKDSEFIDLEVSKEFKTSGRLKSGVLLYSNNHLIANEILSKYKTFQTYEELRSFTVSRVKTKLDELVNKKGIHRIINTKRIKKHPVFCEYFEKIFEMRKKELQDVLDSIKPLKKGGYPTKDLMDTYFGYGLLISTFGDDPVPETITEDIFDEIIENSNMLMQQL